MISNGSKLDNGWLKLTDHALSKVVGFVTESFNRLRAESWRINSLRQRGDKEMSTHWELPINLVLDVGKSNEDRH